MDLVFSRLVIHELASQLDIGRRKRRSQIVVVITAIQLYFIVNREEVGSAYMNETCDSCARPVKIAQVVLPLHLLVLNTFALAIGL